eukprot:1299104-Amorphochlora_amoeboformis.AAC.1
MASVNASSYRVVALTLLAIAAANERTHKYNKGDEVTVWVNKIGPFHNPQETYPYQSLGLCKAGEEPKQKSEGFGALLNGDMLVDSGISMGFRGPHLF